MAVVDIREAIRQGARVVIGLAGISGSGKTRTALELAFGLANYNARKIGFLDTENRRGSLYADVLKDAAGKTQRFMIGDLFAPFSPQRYIDAILQFQALGVEVLVMDSVTHEWEGTGGCEEIAYAENSRMADWNTAKREHKRFMNIMLQSHMHVIACIRAREKVSIEKVAGKTVVTPLGILPVQEKNFMFEMTASVMMLNEGKGQQVMKCPEDLRSILGRQEGYITAADGKRLRDWVDGALPLDAKVELAKATLQTTTEKGLAALELAWKETPKEVRKAISADGKCPDTLKQAAVAHDKMRAASQPGGESLDALNKSVLGEGGQPAEGAPSDATT